MILITLVGRKFVVEIFFSQVLLEEMSLFMLIGTSVVLSVLIIFFLFAACQSSVMRT
jgi:hypothetical protein